MGNDAGAWDILKNIHRRTRMISIVSFTFASVSAGASAMIPLFLEERSKYTYIIIYYIYKYNVVFNEMHSKY